MKIFIGASAVLFATAVFFLFFSPRAVVLESPPVNPHTYRIGVGVKLQPHTSLPQNLPSVPEAEAPSSSPLISEPVSKNRSNDIANQPPLEHPPAVAKAIYITSWSAGSNAKIDSLIKLMAAQSLNAVVIDIKDYSGYVAYRMDAPEVKASGADRQIRILRLNGLIQKLHQNNIYVIGRVTVFQDPVLASAHPEWALKNKTSGTIWLDKHGLAWLDPAVQSVWGYDVAIARDALRRGFDEINFDYVRFASDGDLSVIGYPFWDGKTPKHIVIKKFFAYLREQLPDAKISADLFGIATVKNDDLGIGQIIEDAYPYFDYLSPMVYPSHYGAGFLGYRNPAKHPYEVVKYSMDSALRRLMNYESGGIMNNATNTNNVSATTSSFIIHNSQFHVKFRPWLQVFNLGAVYTKPMIEKEIRAVTDALANNPQNSFAGWLLWDPTNMYSNYRG